MHRLRCWQKNTVGRIARRSIHHVATGRSRTRTRRPRPTCLWWPAARLLALHLASAGRPATDLPDIVADTSVHGRLGDGCAARSGRRLRQPDQSRPGHLAATVRQPAAMAARRRPAGRWRLRWGLLLAAVVALVHTVAAPARAEEARVVSDGETAAAPRISCQREDALTPYRVFELAPMRPGSQAGHRWTGQMRAATWQV